MTIVTCLNFAEEFCFATAWPGTSVHLGKLDGIQYVGDNDLCIDHLQHTEAEVIVEQIGSFEEDGALLITMMMQICNLSGTIHRSAPLDNRVICSCSAYFINGSYGCVSLEELETALLRL